MLMVFSPAAGMGLAQDPDRVVSSTALVNQVSVLRQVCSNETVQLTSQSSGGGAVLGRLRAAQSPMRSDKAVGGPPPPCRES